MCRGLHHQVLGAIAFLGQFNEIVNRRTVTGTLNRLRELPHVYQAKARIQM